MARLGLDDWDQHLFSWVWQGSCRLRRRLRLGGDLAKAPLPSHALRLEALSPKLRLLAAALSGESLELHEAEHVAGYRGTILLLPGSLAIGETSRQAEQLYLLTLCYQVSCRALGLRLPAAGTATGPEAATWLAMKRVLAEMRRELPGVNELIADLGPLMLKARRPVSPQTPAAYALECSLAQSFAPATATAPLVAHPTAEKRSTAVADWCSALDKAARDLAPTPDEAAPSPVDLAEFDASAQRLQRSLRALGGLVMIEAPLPVGWLRLGEAGPLSAEAGASKAPLPADALATGTEREGKAREVVRQIQLGEDHEADNPLVHSFEKVHTAEEYQGGQKAMDGSDELDDQLQAMEELDIREVIRTRERTASIFKADTLLDGSAPELSDATPDRTPDYQYDEWDGKARVYRPAHCNLYIERARRVRPEAASSWITQTRQKSRPQLRQLEQTFAKIELERRPRARQREGAQVDIDAVVSAQATLAAGHTPSDRLYIQRRPARPTLSLLLLLDLSLSSDAYVGGERVLDVSREAIFVVGEALDARVSLAIAGFHSNTRRDCRFVTLKAFGEGWSQCRGRLAGLEPRGYTRIGPALRHGTQVLGLEPTRRKAMVVVTDGQPTDYDRYEGRHGVEDVAQAVREARREGIGCFGLAVARERRSQLGQMFGHDRFALMQRGSELPAAMAKLMTELMKH